MMLLARWTDMRVSDSSLLPYRCSMFTKRCEISLLTLVDVVALLACLYSDLAESQPVIYVNTSSTVNDTSCWTRGKVGSCSTLDLGLQGLWNLSQQHTNSTLMIAADAYDLSSSNFTSFTDVSGLSIVRYSDTAFQPPVTINCVSENVGFSFTNSSDIVITGIFFSQCGAAQKSTSFNFNYASPDFVQFTVGLFFSNCRNVNFSGVLVQGTPGTGVVFYNTVGKNVIIGSAFNDNKFFDEGGGGVYIEFSYCDPQEPDSGLRCLEKGIPNVNPTHTMDSSFYFYECTFYYNQANVSNFQNGTFILPHAQEHLAFGRGGGLSVFFKGTATRNVITIDNCTFKNNSALWGGGIFAEFQDNVSNNTFQVIGCSLAHNTLYYNDLLHEGTGGGGARVGFIYFNDFAALNNTISFDSCRIRNNTAYFGGGVSYYAARNPQGKIANNFWIRNCTFQNNVGRLGAAIDLSLWHPSLNGTEPIPVIEDTLFYNNSAVYNSGQGSLIGVGVVYSDNVILQLVGSVMFENNLGTALAVTGSHIEMKDNSSLYFEHNSGRNGGGLALLGNTYVLISNGSSLYFINNTAQYYGGAIFSYQSGEHDLVSSRSCFIRYYDITADPSDWDAYFYFENNHANNELNSIYASTLLPCIWGGPQGGAVVDDDLASVFCWNKSKWVYQSSCSKEISTAPSSYQLVDSYTAIPGKTLEINATVLDETKHDVTDRTIFIARILEGSARFKGSETLDYAYISHGLIDLYGEPNSTVVIQMETIDPIVIKSKITVTLQGCPPGYVEYYPNGSSSDNSICVCSGSYNTYIVCDNKTFDTEISRIAWIGQVPGFSEYMYLVGESPYVGFRSDGALVNLTGVSPNPKELNSFFCNDSGREGVLCGRCQDRYGVVVNSETFACKLCPEEQVYYNWAFYILTEFLPLTIFFIAIFVLSMTVHFGPLNSYIFYAQVLTTVVKIDADGAIFLDSITGHHASALKNAYTVVYDIWNMNFFRAWLPEFCLSPNISTLTMLSLGYVTALYPLLLLIIFVVIVSLYNRGVWLVVVVFRPLHLCLARFRQWWNLRRSISGGIALFIVLSYTKFSLVTFILLTPTPLYYSNNTIAIDVYYYEGNLNFTSSEAVVYRVVASIVLATFVVLPPVLLVIPSILTFAVRFRCLNCLRHLQPHGKMQEFLDFFHGCFKDGTDGGIDCRYFAGLYFILRIILFSLYAGTATWELQYTAQMIFFLVWAFLFASFRPYKKEWINYVDMSLFLILAAITSLSMYNLLLTRVHLHLSTWAFVMQYILIFIPLFYCVGYFLILFCSAQKESLRQLVVGLKQERVADAIDNEEESARQLEDSTGIPNFLDFTQSTGRLSSRMRLTDPHLWKAQSRRLPKLPVTSASDDLERRPLIPANSDEQSDSEEEERGHSSPVSRTSTQPTALSGSTGYEPNADED